MCGWKNRRQWPIELDIGYIITLLVSLKSNCQATTNIYNLHMYTSSVIFPSTLPCPTSTSTTLYIYLSLTPSLCNFNCGSSFFQQTMIFNLQWPKHPHCKFSSLLLSIILSLHFPFTSFLNINHHLMSNSILEIYKNNTLYYLYLLGIQVWVYVPHWLKMRKQSTI